MSAVLNARNLEMLQRMPIFGAIRSDTLEFLLARTRARDVPQGRYFFRQGESGQSMYVLESGRVSVRRRWGTQEMVLRHFGGGDCFGEMALMDLAARSASVMAETDCRAIEISTSDLAALCDRDPEQFALIQMNMGREVCRRLRVTDELLFKATVGSKLPAVDSGFVAL
jgi:CRP-like cAMP-binding protein